MRFVAKGFLCILLLGAGCSEAAHPTTETPPDTPLEEIVWTSPGCCFFYIEGEKLQGSWPLQRNVGGYSGAGFVTNPPDADASPMTLELSLEPGTYTIWVRAYADSSDRRLSAQLGSVRLEPTHAAREELLAFAWERAGQVEHAGGPVGLRMHDEGSSWVLLDAIILTTRGDFDPDEAAQAARVLPEDAAKMYVSGVVARYEAARRTVQPPRTLEQWESRRTELSERIARAIGLVPEPPSTPLNAQVVGTIDMDGYRLEKVTFESRPGLHVSAHVFVPDGVGPFPVVLSPMGHYKSKAHQPAERSHALAKLGFMTLVYDPFGQGERRSEGNHHDEHWALLLSGKSNLSVMVWETMRALDYLSTRIEADVSRPVSAIGHSGGGLNALYLAVVEPRLGLNAPAGIFTTFHAIAETGRAHDPCVYLPGMAGFTDMGEIAALFAPRPQIILNGVSDSSFTWAGALRAADVTRRVYDLYGAGSRLRMDRYEAGHQLTDPMLRDFYGFVNNFVIHDGQTVGVGDDPVVFPGALFDRPQVELPDPQDPELLVFPDAMLPVKRRTVRDYGRSWALEKMSDLPSPTDVTKEALRQALVDELRWSVEHPPTIRRVGEFRSASGHRLDKVIVEVLPGILLPGHLSIVDPAAPTVVRLHNRQEWTGEALVPIVERGFNGLSIALSASGETVFRENWLAAMEVLIGGSLLARRVHDLRQIRRALSTLGITGPVGLAALDEASAITAVFAQALHPTTYDATVALDVTGTFLEAYERALPPVAWVTDILAIIDMPMVVWLAGEQSLRVMPTSSMYRAHYPSWHPVVAPFVGSSHDLQGQGWLNWLESALRDQE